MVATRSASQKPSQGPSSSSKPSPDAASTTRRSVSRTSNNNNNNAATTTTAITNVKTINPSATTTGWTHTPTTTTLAWLALSLPLVTWDTGYVLGRPATMPGGWAHWPVWAPYELYGNVDHMYGFKQWNAGNGFTAAQGTLNVVETLMYLVYVAIWWRAAPAPAPARPMETARGSSRKSIAGRAAAWAVVVGFAAAVMTVSKTVLYWLNEGFSGFDNIGHNAPWDLLILWIIPK